MGDPTTHVHQPIDPASLARTLNALFMGFQVIGFDWRYLYVNPAAAGHGRTTPEDLVGRTMFEAFPEIEHQELLMSCLSGAMTDRRSHAFENQFTFPNGQQRWFHIRIEPVPEGICVYSVDIHERKVSELALKARISVLEARPPLLRRLWQTLTSIGRAEEGSLHRR